ncbi:hypothetical protein GCM10023405_16520 [Streptomonospora salina]
MKPPGRDPLVASVADGGRRTRRVGDPFIGGAQHQNLDEFVEHGPVGDAWVVAAQRTSIDAFGNQHGELVPDRFDDRRWQGRREDLRGEKTA